MASPRPLAARSSGTNCGFIINRRSTSVAARSSAPRRWSAGATQRGEWFRRRGSSGLPRIAVSSCRSARGCFAKPANRRSPGLLLDCPPSKSPSTFPRWSFRDDGFLDRLLATFERTGVDPTSLQLEITEGVLMKRPKSAASILLELRKLGVQVAIDDFGTGYCRPQLPPEISDRFAQDRPIFRP